MSNSAQNFEKDKNKANFRYYDVLQLIKGAVSYEELTPEAKFFEHTSRLYGDAKSVMGLNLLDPIKANMLYYNKIGARSQIDGPKIGKTYVFFTRPDLNWSAYNIEAIPLFEYIHGTSMGRMLMAMTTFPDRYLGSDTDMQFSPEAIYNSNLDVRNHLGKFEKRFAEIQQTTQENNNTSELDALEQEFYSETSKIIYGENASESLNDPSIDYGSIYTAYDTYNYQDFLNKNNGSDIGIQEHGGLSGSQSFRTDIKNGPNLDFGVPELAKDVPKDFNRITGEYETLNYTTPFIPLLSNTCLNATGSKDFNLENFDYGADFFGTTMTIARGQDEVFSGGEISCEFYDLQNGPVLSLFLLWVQYIHCVSRGYVSANKYNILNRILDYTCSIYIFVCGEDGSRIDWCAKYTGCFPKNVPLGHIAHSTEPDSESLKKFSISFMYNRYEIEHLNVIRDFNFIAEQEYARKFKYEKTESGYVTSALKKGFDWNTQTRWNIELPDGWKYSEINPNLEELNITEENDIFKAGGSGNVPPALIQGSILNGNDFDIDRTDSREIESYDQLSNMVFGGYPRIISGRYLTWVSPKNSLDKDNEKRLFNRKKSVVTTPVNLTPMNSVQFGNEMPSNRYDKKED